MTRRFFFEKNHSNCRTFFLMTQRIDFLFNMTHRTEPIFFILQWLQNWALLFNMTHRNWTLLINMTQSINLSFLENLTQRIELYFQTKNDSKNWTSNNFFQFDSKNWTFSSLTQRVEPQRKKWPNELNLFN